MTDDLIFEAAIDISDSGQRREFVCLQCGADSERASFLLRLVESHFQSGDFIEAPIVRFESGSTQGQLNEKPGDRIGDYELIEEIGRGGMAVVFKALQVESLRRNVALKIIKPGLESDQVIARFNLERQTLAMLNHKNIASIIDAGVSPNGRPFFVMELVDGVPISEFCEKFDVSLAERIRLIAVICRAVEHAHRRGIIHRDIKPSNILVGGTGQEPELKIIDFGIAKTLTNDEHQKTAMTSMGQILGTPQYMSPEQASQNHEQLDTRTDVYSIGTVLYELITGKPPIEETSLMETMQRVVNDVPISPRRFNRSIDRDLETICLKCLEKRAHDRYGSANELVNDLERYLDGRPIKARSIGLPTRVFKWARRAPATASLIVVTMIAFIIVCLGWVLFTWQLKQQRDEIANAAKQLERERNAATQSFEQAHVAMRKYLDAVRTHTPLGSSKDLLFQTELFETGIDFYRDLLATMTPDSDKEKHRVQLIQKEQIDLLIEHGKIQMIAQNYPASVASYDEAIRILNDVDNRPMIDSKGRRKKLALVYTAITKTHLLAGNFVEAESMGRVAVKTVLSTFDNSTNAGMQRWYLAVAKHRFGLALMKQGKTSEAEKAFVEAVRLCEQLSDIGDFQLTRTKVLLALAELYRSQKDFKRSTQFADSALSVINGVCSTSAPLLPRYRIARIASYEELAACKFADSDAGPAREFVDKAIVEQRNLSQENENVEQFALDLARLYRLQAKYSDDPQVVVQANKNSELAIQHFNQSNIAVGQSVIRAQMFLSSAIRYYHRFEWMTTLSRLETAYSILDSVNKNLRTEKCKNLMRAILYRKANVALYLAEHQVGVQDLEKYMQHGGRLTDEDKVRMAICLAESGGFQAAKEYLDQVEGKAEQAVEYPYLITVKLILALQQSDCLDSDINEILQGFRQPSNSMPSTLHLRFRILALCRAVQLVQTLKNKSPEQTEFLRWANTELAKATKRFRENTVEPDFQMLVRDPRFVWYQEQ